MKFPVSSMHVGYILLLITGMIGHEGQQKPYIYKTKIYKHEVKNKFWGYNRRKMSMKGKRIYTGASGKIDGPRH